MKKFPPDIKFKYGWRQYQKRVLDNLNEHLEDNHLHIIAPPGSGKTILGLEVSIRLNKPTLILAPTIAIRNQWIQRFCELFLQSDQVPEWISRDIKTPKFITVSTYQGLHAACSGLPEIDDGLDEEEPQALKEGKSTKEKSQEVIKALKAVNVGTIVVDEAHHLKNAWWQSLTEIKKSLEPTIVGLTATPPYDVSCAEWQRYIELNGPVDAEISVPELVVEGDLCPHQDYIYFSLPTIDEGRKINEYHQRIKNLFNEIRVDRDLINILERHPIYVNPNEHLEWIYTNLEYYSATIIYLNAAGKEISKNHLEIIDNKNLIIPDFNYYWIEILLTFYLYKDPVNFKFLETHQEKIINKLKRCGAMERRSVNFRHSKKINNFLISSIGKLESIDKIVDFECDHLNGSLRMVILTDYIRKEFLVSEKSNDLELNKIGVLPIFEKLRRTNNKKIKIGVLTGSLIIIPTSAFDQFVEIAAKYMINNVSSCPLPYDNAYLIINTSSMLKREIVNIITQVFEAGGIEVLVGTKSLLGEGWDAPFINSLILASFVGSYVLSNQMRGRAIRTEQKNIDKTSNIWHLVCVDPAADDGGDDIQLLNRRFRSFVGVSFGKNVGIENGIARLEIPNNLRKASDIVAENNRMLGRACMRNQLKENWQEALQYGDSLIEEIKIPFPEDQEYKKIKSLYYKRTIKYLLCMLGTGVAGYGYGVLQGFSQVLRHTESIEGLLYWLICAVGLGGFIFGRLAYKSFRVYVKYRDIWKDFHKIGEALLHTLVKIEIIQTNFSKLEVVSDFNHMGEIHCHLEGGTTYEKSVFIKSLQEIIGPVVNPRYIIIRKSFFIKVISQKDYHSLPDIIGRNKKFAEHFEKQWRKLVGSCDLVYTRTTEGRRLLLKSRMHSLASEFENKSERINKWK